MSDGNTKISFAPIHGRVRKAAVPGGSGSTLLELAFSKVYISVYSSLHEYIDSEINSLCHV